MVDVPPNDEVLQELVDLFYYHVISGAVHLEREHFVQVLKRVPESKRTWLKELVDGLMGKGDVRAAWDRVADVLFDRLRETRKGSLLVPTVLGPLVQADLRFSTEITRAFVARCFGIPGLRQATIDILVRLLLEIETSDAPMFKYMLECLDSQELDAGQREEVFISLARNLHGDVGRAFLARSALLPLEPDSVFSVFSVCDRRCTRVMIQGLAESEMGLRLLDQLVGMIVQQPGPVALGGLGKLYLCAPEGRFGEQARARVRASVVLVVEKLRYTTPFDGVMPTVDLLLGLSLGLGLDGPQSRGLARLAVSGVIEILDGLNVTAEEYPAFSQAVVNILGKVSADTGLLQEFISGIGSITGHLYTSLRSDETRERAKIAFQVLEHIVQSQSRIGRPLPAIREIVSQYRNLTSTGPS